VTTSSKRSREPSDDDSDEVIEVSEVSYDGEGPARRSAYKRANVSQRSPAAVDLQLLHAQRAGPSKPRKDKPGTGSLFGLADDPTRSFEDMRLNWDKGDGGSGGGSQPSSPRSSRKSSRQPRSGQSSRSHSRR
jgi:hypothetical protein